METLAFGSCFLHVFYVLLKLWAAQEIGVFFVFVVIGGTGVSGFAIPCSCCDCYLPQSLSPYPSSPLTPDSEEGFIMNIREEGRSTRVRNRPKPQPAKKTRVNAQRYGTTVCQ